ncbi:uncharacterized protein CXorf38-like isoform X5 [Protopterus annectens]|uniref:uncharacterized protein CXorf38-like isoform X5 n=1 Tax=Protopterus annectens TaxID=7888 RepID=UPI001CFADA2E|nr:uncharacterized protein CXorf38-like isoform X5 [Protopterus annectens]
MVFSELASRLNDVGYKNWMKAGYCLLKLRNGLKELVSVEMSVFHQNLIKQNTVLRAGCIGGCKPRGKQFHPNCSVCREWRNEILSHHTNRNGEINWGNCRPWLWSSEHWEVAKAYMPRGSADIQGPDKCDAAALLNLIGFCDHFRFVSQQKVREILSSDWAVVLSGRDDVDGIPNMSNEDEAVQISTMEIELLKEKLQEILLDKQDVLCEEDISRIGKFRCFLEGSKDLGSHFHAAIQRLLNLEQKKEHKHQRSNSNDIEAEKHTEDEKSEDPPRKKQKNSV